MKTYRVKIKKAPVNHMAYGGQSQRLGLDLGIRAYDNSVEDPYQVSGTLQPVPREMANIEAEKGETVYGDMDGDNQLEHMKIGGKRHSQGGTPLNVPEGSFIYSDTAKMKIGGKTLERFGKTGTGKTKYTPAQLAKQYDINKYKAILDNPKSDKVTKRTAEMMIANYERKLAELAIVQEGMKGFPQGIPAVAQPLMEHYAQSQGQEPEAEMRFGGYVPSYAMAGQVNFDIDPYKGGKTKEGSVTPTGKSNAFDRDKEYLQTWEGLIPGVSKLGNKQAQEKIYQYTLQNNPDAIKNMWTQYGLTNEGEKYPDLVGLTTGSKFTDPSKLTPENLASLSKAYTDGFFGARQLDPYTRDKPLKEVPLLNPFPKSFEFTPNTPAALRAPVSSTPNLPAESTLTAGKFNPANVNTPFDYMTPDKLSMFQAISNRAGLKKYLPYIAPVQLSAPDPTFYDPTRELAASAEMSNQERQAAAMFAGPQRMAAANSITSGQAAGRAADILGRYNNLNVGLANQAAAQQTDVMNKQSAINSERATKLYDGNVIANQQFDNSKRMANNDMLKSYINAWNNRSMVSMLNDTNPYFFTDPNTGRMTFRGGPQNIFGSGNNTLSSAPKTWQDYYAYASKELKMPDEQAKNYASEFFKGAKATYADKNNDGVWDSARAMLPGYIGVMGPKPGN